MSSIAHLHHFQLTANRDRWVGFVSSVFIHALLFFVGGALFITGVEYGVEYGSGGIEVNLVAALPQGDTETAMAVPRETEASELNEAVFIEEPKEKTEKQDLSGQDTTTLQSSGGALVHVKPGYLRNPAPRYPEEARRAGQEGLVVLLVRVGREGLPGSLEVQESSGYPILDESAAKAVKEWKFYPAKVGSLPVESKVEVPIRFRLEGD